MDIFFDPLQKRWSHRRAGRHFVWGNRRALLPRLPFSPSLQFKARAHKRRVGPLVGILTSPGETDFSGNRKTFRRIHKALQCRGGLVYVFTPQDVGQKRIKGHVFSEKSRRWLVSSFPYPDVVYNRIPTREDESLPTVQACLKRFKSHNIPYFNGGFLDKWEMYECLLGDPELSVFLPETRLLTRNSLQAALEEWGTVYLKPRAGQKGEGIQTVMVKEDGHFWHRTEEETHDYASFFKMWEVISHVFQDSHYLIQPQILLNQHKGRPYDFRLIAQKKSGEWRLTGAGARLAGENAITTHVPRGGELLMLTEIHPPPDLPFLTELCIHAARRLEEQFPPLEELSFDVGRDISDKYWLFEANAKPMEFDEQEIEAKRMDRLIEIFYEKSGFN